MHRIKVHCTCNQNAFNGQCIYSKERPVFNGRSMEAEAHAIIETTVAAEPSRRGDIQSPWLADMLERTKETGGIDTSIDVVVAAFGGLGLTVINPFEAG
ncbi:hypothetical protein [Corynebacterium cystitidis]|uniref:Uncharacterized protein n=2 Tax=Corynebacterium cystitidis TaxID=35757 RepID=A0A1H9U3T0_9CORY|nr:hypothetical protein [Corynebacterium cystitidis]WJY81163.1 hypothetical protein CCYS_00895 [Corynebacterium cystitidis DSM 20524]SES04220.1 hypothetical protein SAMN05661109_01649 [Corynebacterium cystitidis DSM 20524]SNV89695.1 Uncharacterised protein [Corynebacterium cystitidis]